MLTFAISARARSSQEASQSIRFCEAADGLCAITHPHVELVIWQRRLPLRLRDWLEQLAPAALPDLHLMIRPSDVRRAVVPLLADCGMPSGEMRTFLIDDVERLTRAFSSIAGTDWVDLRLERVDRDGCWKFHRDCVDFRLLCTYRGPATDWILPVHAQEALRAQKRYAGPIQRLASHDVALFRGCAGGPSRGIVHRSPPLGGTGQTRLLLRLSKPFDASPAPWADRKGGQLPAP